jgi:hypothetical protein
MLATFQVRTGLSAPYTDRGRKGYRVALVLKALGIGNWQLGVLTHFSMPSIKKTDQIMPCGNLYRHL